MLPLVLLAASAPWLSTDHGGLQGIIVFGGFVLASAWLELASGRRGSARGTSASRPPRGLF